MLKTSLFDGFGYNGDSFLIWQALENEYTQHSP